MILGAGAYGEVKNVGGKAVKKFEHLSSLVQEYIAGRYLRNYKQIVTIEDADFHSLTSTMKLYDSSLRKWMENNKEPSMETKLKIFHDIITGMYILHCKGLLHADIKPGNILMDGNRAVIGDLGFVSISKYAKVNRTARYYRDKNIVADCGHDMYSLGMLLIELFTWDHPKSHFDKAIDKAVSDKKLNRLLKAMIDDDREKRPTIAEIFEKFFEEKCPKVEAKEYSINTLQMSAKHYSKIKKYMKKTCEIFKINREKKGFKAVLLFLYENKIDSSHYDLYVTCTFMILSSLFGKSGFTEDDVYSICKKKGYDRDHVLKAIYKLASDHTYIDAIMSPNNSSSKQ